MILFRKAAQLRLKRAPAPQSPFWAATTVAPYAARRASPIAIDYIALRASSAERLEVAVCENVADELERARDLRQPLLIDATGTAERVFRRGEEILSFVERDALAATFLASADGSLPSRNRPDTVVVIAAWPPELSQLTERFAEAREKGMRWGVGVPPIFPVTTDRSWLDRLADAAREHGAAFLASIPIELEPTAKQAIARMNDLSVDDDRYAILFHTGVEGIHLTTERRIAALAADRHLLDFIPPPRWEERTNWNAAVLLTLIASRMIAMDLDLDRAGHIARSARTIANLDKPLTRIAETANLSIVEALDPTSVEVLTDWIAFRQSAFVEELGRRFGLRIED